MNLKTAYDPKWANEAHTSIDLTITWEGIDRELPFTAAMDDAEAHGRHIFALAVAGSFGDIAPFSESPKE